MRREATEDAAVFDLTELDIVIRVRAIELTRKDHVCEAGTATARKSENKQRRHQRAAYVVTPQHA